MKISELTRAQLGEDAKRIRVLAANITADGTKITYALEQLDREGEAAAAGRRHRSHLYNNKSAIDNYTGIVGIWAKDANSQRQRADIERCHDAAYNYLALLRDCLHAASADLTRFTYAIVASLDAHYNDLDNKPEGEN